jgi:ribosomal protein S28E/S33
LALRQVRRQDAPIRQEELVKPPATLFELVIDQLTAAAGYKPERSPEDIVSDIIFTAIKDGARTTKKILSKTGYSRSTISKHIRLIEGRGSIRIIRAARNGPCRIEVLRDY